MARKPESQFITSVHKHLPTITKLYRMKNNNPFVGGVPDVWYSGSSRDLWIEYKYVDKYPVRSRLVPGVTRQQLRWIKDRTTEGRSVWIVVGCKDGAVVFRDTGEMETGISPEQAKDRLVGRKDVATSIQIFCNGGTEKCQKQT